MTALWTALAADVVAIGLLAFGIYFRRHFRADLMLAYVALNVSIFAVTAVLADSSAGLGLGLGLFGILSIIRLRSDSISQEEIAYYFVSLVMGLIAGLHPEPVWLTPALSLTLVAVMFVVDHPAIRQRTSRQTITLDRAYPDPTGLKAALEQLLNAEVQRVSVLELDMVRDTTVADVRFKPAVTARPLVRRLSGRAL